MSRAALTVEESSAPLEFCCEEPLISQSKKRNGPHNSQSEKNVSVVSG